MKIFIEKDFITREDADKFIKVIDDLEFYNDRVIDRRVLRFGYDLFNTTDNGTEDRKDVLEMLTPYIKKVEDYINSTYEHPLPVAVSTIWISKQAIGSKIMPHSDTDGGKSLHYSHSAIIYLNTQEKDGEIFFPRLDKEFRPEFGDMISFEARPKESKHGVRRTSQVRYAIPMWLTDQDEFKLEIPR